MLTMSDWGRWQCYTGGKESGDGGDGGGGSILGAPGAAITTDPGLRKTRAEGCSAPPRVQSPATASAEGMHARLSCV